MSVPILPIIGLVGKAIDKIFPDPAQAAQAKATLLELEQKGELAELQAATQVIVAEASGSWLQQSWRPITMLTFLVLVVCDSFGLLAFRLAEQAWTLLQIGLGGYVVGRSGEKIMKSYKGE
jgi:hypothetical protein